MWSGATTTIPTTNYSAAWVATPTEAAQGSSVVYAMANQRQLSDDDELLTEEVERLLPEIHKRRKRRARFLAADDGVDDTASSQPTKMLITEEKMAAALADMRLQQVFYSKILNI